MRITNKKSGKQENMHTIKSTIREENIIFLGKKNKVKNMRIGK